MTFSGADGDWPLVAELKQLLDVTSDDWDDELERQLAAAVAQVKTDVGAWDEAEDVPDESLAQAAIRLAVLLRANADFDSSQGGSQRFAAVATSLSNDPIYKRLLKGHHRRFGIA